MKSMKKLIPAICMLLLSAMLMGTSTYAWFSMNTSVSASGMQVKAKSDGGLAIASYTTGASNASVAPASTAFASTASALWTNAGVTTSGETVTANTGSLYPTSNVKGNDGVVWYKATAESANSYAAAEVPVVLDTTNTDENKRDDTTDYYLQTKFMVKSLDQTAGAKYDLYVTEVKVTDATASKELNKALRVMIVVDGNPYYFAPCYTSALADNTSLKFWNGSAETSYSPTLNTGTNNSLSAPVKICDKVTESSALTATAKAVEIYVYFEGCDENCKSINATAVDTLKISVSFATEIA